MMMEDEDPKPRVVLTAHAKERVDERLRPLFPEHRDPHRFITAMVYEAMSINSFTRKPPWWCRAGKIPKGNHIRFVRTSIDNEPLVIVVGRKDHHLCFVITVITRLYARAEA